MHIALFSTFTPFVRGGAEIVIDDLAEQLQETGCEVTKCRIPFPESYEAPLAATIESARMLCFDEFDKVIAFKFPAYCIRHHGKVIWMFHQFRQVYDLWEHEQGITRGAVGESIRNTVIAADNTDIPRSTHIYTIAREVSNRLKKYNLIDSEVLYPPINHPELYHTEKTGNYIFFPSRITPLKRQHLAIEAMSHVTSGVKLIITGVSEDLYYEQLKKLIREKKLEKRVELRNEWVSDEEKRALIANALGIIYIPYKEDYGLVTLESFYSAKPIITCTDSGGVGEFVTDNVSGFEVQPEPESIAEAADKLFFDKSMAERMGSAGLDEIIRRDITWPSTIKRLLD